jgi:hypothetical protein
MQALTYSLMGLRKCDNLSYWLNAGCDALSFWLNAGLIPSLIGWMLAWPPLLLVEFRLWRPLLLVDAGVTHNIPLLRDVLTEKTFNSGIFTTSYLQAAVLLDYF